MILLIVALELNRRGYYPNHLELLEVAQYVGGCPKSYWGSLQVLQYLDENYPDKTKETD